MRSKAHIDITLRPWGEDDLPLLQRLMGDPAMTEHLGGPETPEKIQERHQRYCRIREGVDAMYVILVGEPPTPAGSIGYWEKEWQGETIWETGWSVLPEFQGQGVASRATLLVAERARVAGRHRWLHAFPSVDNAASNTICRKAGFRKRGEVAFEYPPGCFMRCNDWHLDLHPAAQVYLWSFQVPPEHEEAFRAMYGPAGDWVRLFQDSEDYLGTQLLKDADSPGRYLTLDRWTSAEAREAFLASARDDYDRLDRACERLTTQETSLGSFREVR